MGDKGDKLRSYSAFRPISLMAVVVAVAFVAIAIAGCGSGSRAPTQQGQTDAASQAVAADQFTTYLKDLRPGMTSIVRGHEILAKSNAALQSGNLAKGAAGFLQAAQLYDNGAMEMGAVEAPNGMDAHPRIVKEVKRVARILRQLGTVFARYVEGRASPAQTRAKLAPLQDKYTSAISTYTSALDVWSTQFDTVGSNLNVSVPDWLVRLRAKAAQAQGE